MVEDGRVENVYRIHLMNATESVQRFRIEVDGLPGAVVEVHADLEVGATQARWVPVDVQITPEAAQALGAGAHPMRFRVALQDGGRTLAEVNEKSTFVVPR
jgi:polyferredoxin